MTDPDDATAAHPVAGAIRLIFEFEDDDVRLVSQQRVDVAVTGFDISSRPKPGHYVELRDSEGGVVSRVPARAAFAASAEVFPEEPGEPITRVDVEHPSGAFTVLAPAPPTAQRVAVVRITPAPREQQRLAAGATSDAPGQPDVTVLAEFALGPGA